MGVQGHYPTFVEPKWCLKSFSSTLEDSGDNQILWSGRIATGLFGLTNCASGKRGPRSRKEVLIAPGIKGLEQLFYLGFIPCPVCTEHYKNEILEELEEDIADKYKLDKIADFFDKTKLPFDARRLAWEHIVHISGGLPSRIYVPANLQLGEVYKFADRLKKINSSSPNTAFPSIGFYDTNSPTRFTEYILKQ
jgi:hypothetical protein